MLCSAPMIVVGLTGGVATGKTTVAKMFKQCGAASSMPTSWPTMS